MKTYTVTIKFNQYSDTHTNQTAKQVKAFKAQVAADGEGWSIEVAESDVQKFWYYRGVQVAIIEERQMGYTLVNAFDGSFMFRFANTCELEYR